MDGIIANLKGICDLAEKYNALVVVDDSHATGFVGDTGRGTAEYCGVQGRVDIITGTFGKALGGASGGFTSGRREIIDLLRQRSRPYLFSNTVAPAICATTLKVLEMIESDTSLRDKVMENAKYFRSEMEKNGFGFFYHHHNYEFFKHDGETVFDYILKNAPYINFTLDSYWLQYGGVDVCKTVDRLKGRIECVHMKDYMMNAIQDGEKVKIEPIFAPVGDGTIDFAAFVEHAKAAGAKYFLVEQDNAATLPGTLGQVERSIKYITEKL